jgi:hypothetical protein
MRYPAFVGPSYTSQSKIAGVERCVNLYPEKLESPGAAAEWTLYPTPGFSTFCTLPTTPVRGFYSINGRTFAVGGSSLYEIASSGTVTLRGTGLNNLDGSPVTFASNGDAGGQILISSGSKAYVYDLDANTLTFAVDGANQVGFLDGFFLRLDGSTLGVSALEDGTSWDPLDVAQRSTAPDRWSALIVSRKEIWLFGSLTSEVWYNKGASFPFIPNPSAFIPTGIAAPYSLTLLENAPIWLGQTADGAGIVFRADGYRPVRVSTHAVEYAIGTYATINDAQAWTYQEGGHTFYVLTFPTAGATWVYDGTTGLWHERGAWNGSTFGTLPVFGHTYAFGKHLTGDSSTGAVYQMATTITSDGSGRTLRRLRRAPHLVNEGKRVTYDRFQLDLEAGLGLSSGQGSDPQVMLRWSNDGGQTWSNEHTVSAGAQGVYKARAQWRRLGQARDRVFELSMSDPIPWRLVDAWIDLRPGVS